MTQKTRAAVETEITSLFADNGTGAITAASLRTVVNDMCDSALFTLTDTLPTFAGILLSNGTALTTDTTNAHTASLAAYYTTGTAYENLLTLTNGTAPNLNIAASTHGTVTIDGAVVGGVTPAAGSYTTLSSSGLSTLNSLTVTTTTTHSGDVTIANGIAIKPDTTNAHTALLQAYYTTGTAYETLATLTNGTTPSLSIAASTHGTVAIDGATLGGVTPNIATTATTVSANTTANVGKSAGGAGTLNVYPTTTANGKLVISAINNTGNFTSTLTNSNIGQATVYSLPETGAATAILAPISNKPQAVGSTLVVTAAMSGKALLLDTAGGSAATLPAATGSGNTYYFVVKTTATSGAHKILPNSVSDFMNGIVTGENANTAKCFASAAATNHSIQMPFAGTQPSGGFIGDWFQLEDIATNLWQVSGMYQAGTTPTTPFSTATT